MKESTKKDLDGWAVLGAVAIVQGSFLFGQAAFNRSHPFHEIGEGYSVRELGNTRYFYIGTTCGSARVCIDKNKDGSLDATMVNAPISPLMGGPGYRLMTVKTTEEDCSKFERANYLLNSEEQ